MNTKNIKKTPNRHIHAAFKLQNDKGTEMKTGKTAGLKTSLHTHTPMGIYSVYYSDREREQKKGLLGFSGCSCFCF